MAEQYVEKLWGKIDFLHEKTLKEHSNLNIFSEIITKYQQALTDFSKSIDNIKHKNADIVDAKEKGNTIDLTITNFKQALKSHVDEFKECSNHMKKSIINPIIKTIDDKYTEEKELYYQYNKSKNLYNNSKINLEKARKEFEASAKICESNIFNMIQSKYQALNSEEDLVKYEERMKLSITSTKNLEDKYYKLLEDTNKARENEINKQKELLKFYQIINTDFYLKLNCIISYFIPMVKKMFTSILLSMDALDYRFKNINIQQDMNNFIEKNKTDFKRDDPIPFIPYTPEADLTKNFAGIEKKELETLDINYQVISTMHQNFRDIRKDLNMIEEEKKYRLRFLCTQIFKIGPGISFNPKEKKELINLLKEPFYKSYFLVTLSKQRTKGRFQRSETLIKDLSDIIHNILDESQKNKDYESAKNCIILSQTFFHEKKNQNDIKKIYLFDYIKNYKWLQSLDFWEGIIEHMIQNEIAKNEEVNKKNNVINETQEDIKSRLSNIGFSQVLSYSNNMIEFKIEKKDITKIVDSFIKKYGIEESMAEAIYENIKNTSPLEEDEEDEKYFKEYEEEFQIKKNNMINNDEEEDDSSTDNIIEGRPRTSTITKQNEKMIIESRSKSIKAKKTPYKNINKDNDNSIEKEKEKDNENKINKNVEEVNVKGDNEIIEDNTIEDIKNNEKEENKNINNIKTEDEKNKIIDKEEKNSDSKGDEK